MASESKAADTSSATTAPAAAHVPVPDVVAKSRSIAKEAVSRGQAEGAGARVFRSIGGAHIRNFDPFLMLDEFHVKKPAGFPDHPHRGFETVTYMFEGHFIHEDFCGHKGTIGPGDLQWMTAGRGIVHAEMPKDSTENVGLQLWVNLAAKDKMVEPAYQELRSEDIPKVDHEGVKVAVIAGNSFGIKSPVYTRTPTMYLDFKLEAGKTVHQQIPAGWNAFIYTVDGTARIGEGATSPSSAKSTLLLSNEEGEDGISVTAGDEGSHFVLIAGKPIGEPIVQHGPFVMNTREEIMQAMMDYQANRNGFEAARGFESSISRGV